MGKPWRPIVRQDPKGPEERSKPERSRLDLCRGVQGLNRAGTTGGRRRPVGPIGRLSIPQWARSLGFGGCSLISSTYLRGIPARSLHGRVRCEGQSVQ